MEKLGAAQDFAEETVLISAGPTREPSGPVRYVSNRSSGKMGYSLATEAFRRGAHVTLVSGPVDLAAPRGIDLVLVRTAKEMYDAVMAALPASTIIVKNAARERRFNLPVFDYERAREFCGGFVIEAASGERAREFIIERGEMAVLPC